MCCDDGIVRLPRCTLQRAAWLRRHTNAFFWRASQCFVSSQLISETNSARPAALRAVYPARAAARAPRHACPVRVGGARWPRRPQAAGPRREARRVCHARRSRWPWPPPATTSAPCAGRWSRTRRAWTRRWLTGAPPGVRKRPDTVRCVARSPSPGSTASPLTPPRPARRARRFASSRGGADAAELKRRTALMMAAEHGRCGA